LGRGDTARLVAPRPNIHIQGDPMKIRASSVPAPSALALLFLLASVAAPGSSVAQEGLSPLDVVMLRSVSGVYPSPDGDRVAFTRSIPRGPDQGVGGGFTNLFIVDTEGDGGERALISGTRSIGGVTWAPGGESLTFLERRDGDSGRQLYALPLAGGEPVRVFESSLGIGQYRWRPDGGAVAFTATLPPPDGRARARAAGFQQRVHDEDWNPIGLFIWFRESGEIRAMDLPGSVFALDWSPDGSRLALAIAPRNLTDDFYMFSRIHLLDVESGDVRQLVDNPGKLGPMGWSPDGSALAYISAVDARDPHAGMLFMADARTGEVTSLTPGLEGMVHGFEWLEPETMRLVLSRGAQSVVSDFDVGGRGFRDLPATGTAFGSVHTAGGTVAAVVSGPRHPGELYTLADGTWTRRTVSNPGLEEVALSRQEIHSFTARDGVDVEGILLYPLDFQEGVRYPLVIVVHGGPESHYNNGWMTGYSTWGQLLSRKGYFVWYPNYRSSTGRGVEYAKDDHGDLAGTEFDDQVDAIRHFADLGWVDPDRVGLGGGSYGGYAGAWAATRQTEYFAAAVAFVPIAHVATKYLTTDIPWEYYYVHYEEEWPFEQWDYMEERSPLTYAPQSRTPLLLAGGTADPRVHPSQPFMLYRAIEATTGTPVRYVQYPGEGHGNSSNVYRYDYLLRVLRWFDHYLRPGDHRSDPLPPLDLDYGPWLEGRTP
jgi:dipeptidyl aminopeptidase/acylaminoacyl peptidase